VFVFRGYLSRVVKIPSSAIYTIEFLKQFYEDKSNPETYIVIPPPKAG